MNNRPVSVEVASAWSSADEVLDASLRAVDAVQGRLSRPPQLVLLLGTLLDLAQLEQAATLIDDALASPTIIGATADALIAGEGTLSQTRSVGMLAIAGDGVRAHPFTQEDLRESGEDFPATIDRMSEAIGAADDTRATIMLASSRGLAIQSMLPRLNAARGVGRRFPILAGIVDPGSNDVAMLAPAGPQRGGIVGMTLSGDLAIDAITSQGAAPIGPELIVTDAKHHLVRSLSGRPALQVLQSLGVRAGACLLGRLIDENRPTRGRGDFLMRTIVGVDPSSGSIALDEPLRPGQTVRFHRHDPPTARGDLEMLLDAQKLHGPAKGAIVFAGCRRGIPEGPLIDRAFAPPSPGTSRSKGGAEITPHPRGLPILGISCSAEVGPIRGVSYLHHSSAVVGLIREPSEQDESG